MSRLPKTCRLCGHAMGSEIAGTGCDGASVSDDEGSVTLCHGSHVSCHILWTVFGARP